jgi:eukaryotic-like serine/threonine-protein kinase
VLVAGLTSTIWSTRPQRAIPTRTPIRFFLQPPENTWFDREITSRNFVLSPKGGQLAFITRTLDQPLIWIRSLDSLKPRALAGTEGAYTLFWSPDSQYVIFYASGKLKKVVAAGGPPQVICDFPESPWSGTALSTGDLLLNTRLGATYRVSASGNVMRLPEKAILWPEILPDQEHFLCMTRARPQGKVESLSSSAATPLMPTDSRIEYAPPLDSGRTGHLLYVRSGTLMAQPFEARSLRLAGDPEAIEEGVPYFRPSAAASFSVSQDGILAYQTGETLSRLIWVDRSGNELGTVGTPADIFGPMRISPDGQKIAAGVRTLSAGGADAWIYEVGRNVATRFTFDPGTEAQPVWSPDGKRIVFGKAEGGPPNLWWKAVGDGGSGEALAPAPFQIPSDWSNDGRFILYQTSGGDLNGDVWAMPVAGAAGNRKPVQLLHSQFDHSSATFSPDSKWIAFVSNDSGRSEVYVQAFQAESDPKVVGERFRISTEGGAFPRWRRDGKELFFVATDYRLMATQIQTGPAFHAAEPVPLFRLRSPMPRVASVASAFDVAPDGKRFLVANTDPSQVRPLTVVVNWQAALKR